MATAVRYNGPSTSATVRGSDGVLYTCPNGSQITVPDDTAIALFAEGWTAPDGTTPGYTPPAPSVVEEVFLVNGALSKHGSGGTYSPVLAGSGPPTQAPPALMPNRGPLYPLKRNVLLLDNGANSQPEQSIADPWTGAEYVLYYSTGVGLLKATGTKAAPASPDPTVSTFVDLGLLRVGGPGAGAVIAGDAPHIVIHNATYFLFAAQSTAQGSGILVYTAPQFSGGNHVALENAVWSASQFALHAAAQNPTMSQSPTLGAASSGSLPATPQTFGVTALDTDSIESGISTVTVTPNANGTVTLTWTAPATGEVNGFYVYRNGQRIATIAHGTLTYTVTGAEALGANAPTYTKSSRTRLDEPFVYYDDVAGQWRMAFMGFDPATAVEQTHLANLSVAGAGGLTAASLTFVTQNGGRPIIPAGNYAAVFGEAIPGGAANATTYDYEGSPDPFVFRVGKNFVFGYSNASQGSVATTQRFAVAAAITTDHVTFTKLGVLIYPPAAMNPADAALGAALDARGQNREAASSWRGSFRFGVDGLLHFHHCGKKEQGNAQGYYSQYDASGLLDAILGVKQWDPWTRVEAESTDPRLTFTGTWTTTANFVYWSGGAIGGTGGKARTTTTAGDQATFDFVGRAVRVQVGRVSTAGHIDVLLDGGGTEGVDQFTNVDLTSASVNWAKIFAAQFDNLTPGPHRLTVRVSAGSTGTIMVDAFDYIPTAGMPA